MDELMKSIAFYLSIVFAIVVLPWGEVNAQQFSSDSWLSKKAWNNHAYPYRWAKKCYDHEYLFFVSKMGVYHGSVSLQ